MSSDLFSQHRYNYARSPFEQLNPFFTNLGVPPEFARILQMVMQATGEGLGASVFGLNSTNFATNTNFYQANKTQLALMQRGAAAQQGNIVEMMRGVSNAMGNGWSDSMQQTAEGMARFIEPILPFLSSLAPGLVDQLMGRRGDAKGFYTSMMPFIERTSDPSTGKYRWGPEAAAKYTDMMYRDLYEGEEGHNRLLKAGDMGQTFDWMFSTGRFKPTETGVDLSKQSQEVIRDILKRTKSTEFVGTDKDIIEQAKTSSELGNYDDVLSSLEQLSSRGSMNLGGKIDFLSKSRDLRDMEKTVNALRELFGEAGDPNAPIASLVAALEKLTGGSAKVSQDRLWSQVRNAANAGRAAGLDIKGVVEISNQMAGALAGSGMETSLANSMSQFYLNMHGQLSERGMMQGWGAEGIEKTTAMASQNAMNFINSTFGQGIASLERYTTEQNKEIIKGSNLERLQQAMVNSEQAFEYINADGTIKKYNIGEMTEGMWTDVLSNGLGVDSIDVQRSMRSLHDNQRMFNDNPDLVTRALGAQRSQKARDYGRTILPIANERLGAEITSAIDMIDVTNDILAYGDQYNLNDPAKRAQGIKNIIKDRAKKIGRQDIADKLDQIDNDNFDEIYRVMDQTAFTTTGSGLVTEMNVYSEKQAQGVALAQKRNTIATAQQNAGEKFQMLEPLSNLMEILQTSGEDISAKDLVASLGIRGITLPESVIKALTESENWDFATDVTKQREFKNRMLTLRETKREKEAKGETLTATEETELKSLERLFDENGNAKMDVGTRLNAAFMGYSDAAYQSAEKMIMTDAKSLFVDKDNAQRIINTEPMDEYHLRNIFTGTYDDLFQENGQLQSDVKKRLTDIGMFDAKTGAIDTSFLTDDTKKQAVAETIKGYYAERNTTDMEKLKGFNDINITTGQIKSAEEAAKVETGFKQLLSTPDDVVANAGRVINEALIGNVAPDDTKQARTNARAAIENLFSTTAEDGSVKTAVIKNVAGKKDKILQQLEQAGSVVDVENIMRTFVDNEVKTNIYGMNEAPENRPERLRAILTGTKMTSGAKIEQLMKLVSPTGNKDETIDKNIQRTQKESVRNLITSNGREWLTDIFRGNEELANKVWNDTLSGKDVTGYFNGTAQELQENEQFKEFTGEGSILNAGIKLDERIKNYQQLAERYSDTNSNEYRQLTEAFGDKRAVDIVDSLKRGDIDVADKMMSESRTRTVVQIEDQTATAERTELINNPVKLEEEKQKTQAKKQADVDAVQAVEVKDIDKWVETRKPKNKFEDVDDFYKALMEAPNNEARQTIIKNNQDELFTLAMFLTPNVDLKNPKDVADRDAFLKRNQLDDSWGDSIRGEAWNLRDNLVTPYIEARHRFAHLRQKEGESEDDYIKRIKALRTKTEDGIIASEAEKYGKIAERYKLRQSIEGLGEPEQPTTEAKKDTSATKLINSVVNYTEKNRSREEISTAQQEIFEQFNSADAAELADLTGLTVEEVEDLKLQASNPETKVDAMSTIQSIILDRDKEVNLAKTIDEEIVRANEKGRKDTEVIWDRVKNISDSTNVTDEDIAYNKLVDTVLADVSPEITKSTLQQIEQMSVGRLANLLDISPEDAGKLKESILTPETQDKALEVLRSSIDEYDRLADLRNAPKTDTLFKKEGQTDTQAAEQNSKWLELMKGNKSDAWDYLRQNGNERIQAVFHNYEDITPNNTVFAQKLGELTDTEIAMFLSGSQRDVKKKLNILRDKNATTEQKQEIINEVRGTIQQRYEGGFASNVQTTEDLALLATTKDFNAFNTIVSGYNAPTQEAIAKTYGFNSYEAMMTELSGENKEVALKQILERGTEASSDAIIASKSLTAEQKQKYALETKQKTTTEQGQIYTKYLQRKDAERSRFNLTAEDIEKVRNDITANITQEDIKNIEKVSVLTEGTANDQENKAAWQEIDQTTFQNNKEGLIGAILPDGKVITADTTWEDVAKSKIADEKVMQTAIVNELEKRASAQLENTSYLTTTAEGNDILRNTGDLSETQKTQSAQHQANLMYAVLRDEQLSKKIANKGYDLNTTEGQKFFIEDISRSKEISGQLYGEKGLTEEDISGLAAQSVEFLTDEKALSGSKNTMKRIETREEKSGPTQVTLNAESIIFSSDNSAAFSADYTQESKTLPMV